ncbi:MAG TPA: TolC family protein [Bacteroidota bacterium]|nr:TolC family protein [Bacteroidota bacterium]
MKTTDAVNNGRPALLIVAFLALGVRAGAQTTLDLPACIAAAEKNSPGLRIADNVLRTASLSRSELNTAALPQVQAVMDAIYLPVPPRYGYDPAITDGGEVRGVLSVRQSLYDSGVRGLKMDQADADVERAGHERRQAGLDLTLAVTQAFYDALRAHEQSALQAEGVDELEAYRLLVDRLYRAGSASATDRLKTELQVSTARIALAKAGESEQGAKIALEELIGISPDTSLLLSGSLADSSSVVDTVLPPPVDPDRTVDMTIAGMLVTRSMLDEDISRHERLPDISLFADAGYLTSGDNLRLPASERLNGLGYEIGIGIQFPILNWGATGYRTEQREVATDDMRNRKELLRRSIASDAMKLRIELGGARRRLRVLEENLAKARDNFILTKSKFAAGASLAIEVLSAEQTMIDARTARIDALADIRVLRARLDRLNAH